jgi:hypothetical protein
MRWKGHGLDFAISACAYVSLTLLMQALLLLQQRGVVDMVDGGWRLCASAAL